MDNAQKAIMVGVGLFITIIIISAVLLIVNLGTGLVDDATDNLGSISSSLQNQLLAQYDNKQLTGVQVKDAMQKYMNSNEISLVLVGYAPLGEPIVVASVGAKNFGKSGLNMWVNKDFVFCPLGYARDLNGNGIVKTMRQFTDQENTQTYISNASRWVSRIIYTGMSEEEAIKDNKILGVVFIPLADIGETTRIFGSV